jgi:uridine phosphorylase
MEKEIKENKFIPAEYPILEYDPYSKPIIEAKHLYEKSRNKYGVTRCLVTYFQDVVERYERDEVINQVFRIKTEGVRPRVYDMEMPDGEHIYIMPVAGGAPQAARALENMAAMGITKFMVCGGAGTLDDDYTRAHVLVPVAAVRDEGTSYHYMPPSREVHMNEKVLKSIEKTLTALNEPFLKVKTWTTDGNFRETEDKVAFRKSEGCSTVEMETSAFFAVAEHKKLMCGQLLYAGDVVAKEGWQYRNWHTKTDIREKLFDLSIKCLLDF